MKRVVNAVVFDADGTLLDTREFILQAYEHTLAAYGHTVPERDFIRGHMGLPLHDCYNVFAPGGDNDALCHMHDVFQKNNYELIDSYEELVLTLDTLRDRGFKIGICSSRTNHLLEALERVGIKDHCDVIIAGKDVTKHKPNPEGFLKALMAMSVSPDRAVMVGDTPQDIGAGKNGGAALTIGVTHGFGTREALIEMGADHVVDRLSDIIPLL
ncbi:HAD-IA family hydrolase [Candidatus Kaiserbacteria bacterium]|nr:HAD-IA family hydrolase [Candidatus Kaiserbacteria bacterium]